MQLEYPGVLNTYDGYMPNFFIPEPRGRFHGLWLVVCGEGNKTFTKDGGPTKHNSYSSKRVENMKRLEDLGFKCLVVRGFNEAKQAVEDYLKR